MSACMSVRRRHSKYADLLRGSSIAEISWESRPVNISLPSLLFRYGLQRVLSRGRVVRLGPGKALHALLTMPGRGRVSGRTMQSSAIFWLLFSWFTGRWGPKSAEQQSENRQTWGFCLSLAMMFDPPIIADLLPQKSLSDVRHHQQNIRRWVFCLNRVSSSRHVHLHTLQVCHRVMSQCWGLSTWTNRF